MNEEKTIVICGNATFEDLMSLPAEKLGQVMYIALRQTSGEKDRTIQLFKDNWKRNDDEKDFLFQAIDTWIPFQKEQPASQHAISGGIIFDTTTGKYNGHT